MSQPLPKLIPDTTGSWLTVSVALLGGLVWYAAGLYDAIATTRETIALASSVGCLCVLRALISTSARARGRTPIGYEPAETSRLALHLIIVVAVAWVILVVLQFALNDWDEGAYATTGLAWLGHPVAAATHRAPGTSWLFAMAGGNGALLNGVLTTSLLLALLYATRSTVPANFASVCVVTVFGNNLTLVATLNGLSELPAAIAVLLSFIALERRWLGVASILFGLSVLTRYNLAPVAVVATVFVLLRYGTWAGCRFALTGAAVGIAGMCTLLVFDPNPIASVLALGVNPAADWADIGNAARTFASRFIFYLGNAFFVGPAVMISLVVAVGLALPRIRYLSSTQWVWCLVVPTSVFAYMVTMMFIGGHFGRFMTPISPAAVVAALVALAWITKSASDASRLRAILLVLFWTTSVAWTISPATFAIVLKENLTYRLPLDETFVERVRALVPRDEVLYLAPTPALAQSNGYPIMAALRRNTFVIGERDRNYTPIPIESSSALSDLLRTTLGDTQFALVPTAVPASMAGFETLAEVPDYRLVRRRVLMSQ